MKLNINMTEVEKPDWNNPEDAKRYKTQYKKEWYRVNGDTVTCEVCYKKYKKYNQKIHEKSQFHQVVVMLKNNNLPVDTLITQKPST